MLRVLPPTFEPVFPQVRLQGLFSWVGVVKRATSLFNLFFSEVAKQFANFFVARDTVPLLTTDTFSF